MDRHSPRHSITASLYLIRGTIQCETTGHLWALSRQRLHDEQQTQTRAPATACDIATISRPTIPPRCTARRGHRILDVFGDGPEHQYDELLLGVTCSRVSIYMSPRAGLLGRTSRYYRTRRRPSCED